MFASELAEGRDNNFNLIRMIAASAVIVSHSYPLSLGVGAAEPLHSIIAPLDLGKAAVRVFFAISGFFILKSFDRRDSLFGFVMARVGRIVPALTIIVLIGEIAIRLGLSFAHNPWPHLFNGPLWTLYYETLCYVVLAVLGLCGVYRRWRFPAFLAAYAIFYSALINKPINFIPLALPELTLPFVLGMAVYHYRAIVPLNGPIALSFFAVAFLFPRDASWSIALSYAALWLGAAPQWTRIYNRLGDYSYGTYIFAWPIQQTVALLLPVAPAEMMLLALPVTWMLGALSWHYVERPCMRAIRNYPVTFPVRRITNSST